MEEESIIVPTKKLRKTGRKLGIHAQWNLCFRLLQDFQTERGHCRVPKTDQYKQEYSWIVAQRRRRFQAATAQRPITQQEIDRLDSIGFIWSPKYRNHEVYDERWKENFECLIRYKTKYGDCIVSQSYKNDALGQWVQTQRSKYTQGKLKEERFGLLESIGFVWNVIQDRRSINTPGNSSKGKSEEKWDANFECLKIYKIQHGDCHVKQIKTKQEDGAVERSLLANWVQTQRGLYKKGELKAEQITKLENIGFAWTRQRSERSYQVEQTVTPKGPQDSSCHTQMSTDDDASSEEDKVEARRTSRKRKCEEADSRDDSDGKQEIVESKLPPSNNPASFDIGTRVAVYWADDDEYYSGTVSRKFGRTAFVDYDDGESEWIDVKKHKVVKLCDDTSKASSPDVDLLEVGSRISVWWPLEKENYVATLTETISQDASKPHFLRYDDGDEEWTNLAHQTFSLL